MAHFAEIDDNNVVVRVLVVPDEQEHRGHEYLANDCQLGGRWIQTSYNRRIRKNFAGPGMYYDSTRDAFYERHPPLPSFVFNEDTCRWEHSVPMPDMEHPWEWDESSLQWRLPQWYLPN